MINKYDSIMHTFVEVRHSLYKIVSAIAYNMYLWNSRKNVKNHS